MPAFSTCCKMCSNGEKLKVTMLLTKMYNFANKRVVSLVILRTFQRQWLQDLTKVIWTIRGRYTLVNRVSVHQKHATLTKEWEKIHKGVFEALAKFVNPHPRMCTMRTTCASCATAAPPQSRLTFAALNWSIDWSAKREHIYMSAHVIMCVCAYLLCTCVCVCYAERVKERACVLSLLANSERAVAWPCVVFVCEFRPYNRSVSRRVRTFYFFGCVQHTIFVYTIVCTAVSVNGTVHHEYITILRTLRRTFQSRNSLRHWTHWTHRKEKSVA